MEVANPIASRMNIGTPEEYRKRKVALISGMFNFPSFKIDSLTCLLVACPIADTSGISGQDGSYLAEFLLEKGYFVHG